MRPRGALDERPGVRKSNQRRSIPAGLAVWLYLPQRIQAERDHRGLAVDRQRPGELPAAEILRHFDRENAPLPAGQKMAWLAPIRPTWLDAVVGPGGDFKILFQIAVVVAHQGTEPPVPPWEPPFQRTPSSFPPTSFSPLA